MWSGDRGIERGDKKVLDRYKTQKCCGIVREARTNTSICICECTLLSNSKAAHQP